MICLKTAQNLLPSLNKPFNKKPLLYKRSNQIVCGHSKKWVS